MSDEILGWSATQIASRVRAGEISPREVVETHLRRLEKANARVNAVCERMFEDARETASAQTERLAQGERDLPPLFGVPFTIKEMFAVQGRRRTGGSIHRRDDLANTDATLVRRLREAGAIPLATTNVPELGFWFEAENTVYGRTNNPYDQARTSGGSSGGEGALIGAGASPFGLGSDIGGSVRLPAAFCGVFGHKPTHLLMPISGHFPYTDEDLARLTGPKHPLTDPGFLARKSEDLPLLLRTLMGPDGIDPDIRSSVQLTEPVQDPSQLRVLYCPSPVVHLCRETSAEVSAGVLQAARLFEQYGARIEEVDPRLFVRAGDLWGAAVRSTKERRFEDSLTGGGELQLSREMARLVGGGARYTLPALLVALFERLQPGEGRDYAPLLAELAKMKQRLAQMLRGPTILLMPTHPRTAFKHGSSWHTPFDFLMTGIVNALELPATSCPVGKDSKGLPLAVQVVAAQNSDLLCMKAAEWIESGFGGWSDPFN